MIRLNQNFKQIFFVLVLSLFIGLLIEFTNDLNKFLTALFVGIITLLLQITIIYKQAEKKLTQLQIPKVNRYSNATEITLHYIMPVLFLIDIGIYIYYNPIVYLSPLVLIFSFVSFLLLFINIRAYFEDKFNIETNTHFIYFFISVFSVFCLNIFLLNLTSKYDLPLVVSAFVLLFSILVMFYFSFLENIHLNIFLFIIFITISLIIAALGIGLYQEFGSILRSSFVTTLFFYFINALFVHKKEGTLSLVVCLEYLSIIGLSLVLLFGINS